LLKSIRVALKIQGNPHSIKKLFKMRITVGFSQQINASSKTGTLAQLSDLER
jgi:hypothetical protein